MTTTIAERRYGGRGLADRREDRRARLVEAAIALYGRCGYRNAGVRAVCREAGLTERYFYEGFANSEALLAAAYDTAVDRLVGRLRAVAGEGAADDPARPHRVLTAYYAALRDHPHGARVFLVEVTGVSAAIDRAVDAALERFAALIVEVHDPAGVGPLASEPLMRRGVVGGLYHIALAWLGEGFARPIDEVVAAAMPLCRLAEPIRATPAR